MSQASLSKERKKIFLATLRATGNVSESAEIAKISRSRLYQVRKNEQQFADKWDEAIAAVEDRIEAEAVRRAISGVEETYYYQGKECGTVRKYSDQLLMFLLKNRFPERYGETSQAAKAATDNVVFKLNFTAEAQSPQENHEGKNRDDSSEKT